ncbi:hypothetical protein Tco_0912908 [Tanacetum coccineum]
MLVQPTEDEGTPSPPHLSEAIVEPQTDPSPRPSPSTHIPDSIPESSGGNHGDQAKEIKHLKAQIKKLQKKAKPVITHHRAWMKSVSLKKRLAGKKSKESVSKQGRKSAKVEPSVHKDPLFDELPDDTLDYMDTEDAQDVGRTRDVVNEEKPNVSTDKPKVNTDKEKDSTVSPDEDTDDRTDEKSATPTTPTTTPTMFGDDETIAQVLLNMSQAKAVSREKEKGVELKDKIEEEDEFDTESEGIPEAEKKFKQLARDEEMARKVQEDWEAEEEVKKIAEEEAIKTALSNEYDFIQARIEADRLLALRLQDEEREQFTVEERAKFLHDTIAAQRRFLAEQRAIAIRNKPPTRTQLDESFTAVGSTEDERRIKEMNEGVKDPDQKSLKKMVVEETPKTEDTAKVPVKVDVTEQGTKKRKGGHIKMISRKRKRTQPDVNNDDEHRKCLKIVTFEGHSLSQDVLHSFDRQDLFSFVELMMEAVLRSYLRWICIEFFSGDLEDYDGILQQKEMTK